MSSVLNFHGRTRYLLCINDITDIGLSLQIQALKVKTGKQMFSFCDNSLSIFWSSKDSSGERDKKGAWKET